MEAQRPPQRTFGVFVPGRPSVERFHALQEAIARAGRLADLYDRQAWLLDSKPGALQPLMYVEPQTKHE